MDARRASLTLLLALAPARSGAQSEIWREEFDNGCAQLCLAGAYAGPNGPWRVVDVSPPGSAANVWYVSCAEEGAPEGACGRGCANPDASLHVGNVATSPAAFIFCPTGDCGAAYDATDDTVVSDKRAESPPIDTTGRGALTATFLFLGEGVPCSDSADFVVSVDGGLTWGVVSPCLTSDNSGCFPQGEWTRHTVALPAAASGVPGLRLGFHWRNDGDFFGQDPSFAVDELVLLEQGGCPSPVPELPRDLGNHLRGVKGAPDADFEWSAMGAPLPTTTHYHVYRTGDARLAFPAGWPQVAGDAPTLDVQAWSDPAVIGDGATWYYDVRSAGDCEAIGPR